MFAIDEHYRTYPSWRVLALLPHCNTDSFARALESNGDMKDQAIQSQVSIHQQ